MSVDNERPIPENHKGKTPEVTFIAWENPPKKVTAASPYDYLAPLAADLRKHPLTWAKIAVDPPKVADAIRRGVGPFGPGPRFQVTTRNAEPGCAYVRYLGEWDDRGANLVEVAVRCRTCKADRGDVCVSTAAFVEKRTATHSARIETFDDLERDS